MKTEDPRARDVTHVALLLCMPSQERSVAPNHVDGLMLWQPSRLKPFGEIRLSQGWRQPAYEDLQMVNLSHIEKPKDHTE